MTAPLTDSARAFNRMIAAYDARMTQLRAQFENDGQTLRASSPRDPGYVILLTRNTDDSSPWRVTSFRDGQPIGHRAYDHLTDGPPVNNALAEFHGMVVLPRRTRTPKED